ncbi:unnamed protein product [Diabrotica balteata]|uniref:Uncharacterized protein n=1 Tax=Diabrotica balteata TaxID=107213 RepID=A0A9N9XKQ7_DIABA|nr:unnamed protein product [Diabrotica balteata]
MASGRSEYNQKIKIFVGLAPAAYMRHNRHPLLLIPKSVVDFLKDLLQLLNIYEMDAVSNSELFSKIFQGMCGEKVNYRINCRPLIDFLSDSLNSLFDYSLAPEIFTTTPAGMGFFQVLHYVQMHTNGRFQKYDWGPETNLQKYNSTVPPKYDWSKITCPTVLIYGLSDALVNHQVKEAVVDEIPEESISIPGEGPVLRGNNFIPEALPDETLEIASDKNSEDLSSDTTVQTQYQKEILQDILDYYIETKSLCGKRSKKPNISKWNTARTKKIPEE